MQYEGRCAHVLAVSGISFGTFPGAIKYGAEVAKSYELRVLELRKGAAVYTAVVRKEMEEKRYHGDENTRRAPGHNSNARDGGLSIGL